MKKIAVLGSTGSIGVNTLNVARHLKDSIEVKALTAHSNIELLKQQIDEFHPSVVAVFDEKKAKELKKMTSVKVLSGQEGINEVASFHEVNFVVVAIVGVSAISPTLCAIKSGKAIGLANKETLVSAGGLIMSMVEKMGGSLIPIDSEHSAIFQCLEGRPKNEVHRIILTASGGPFRNFAKEELKKITLEQALKHPTWQMGRKITIDSSTLMNKGLEMIEAHFLFQIPAEKIDVVIHPQSVIHSMVEFIDGSTFAQLSDPHMTYPIQYALTYPERKKGMRPYFDFLKNPKLEFFPPDSDRFPSLRFAHEAMKKGGSLPCFLNAANEVLVDRFEKKEISWFEILQKLEHLIARHHIVPSDSIETIFQVDQEARLEAVKA